MRVQSIQSYSSIKNKPNNKSERYSTNSIGFNSLLGDLAKLRAGVVIIKTPDALRTIGSKLNIPKLEKYANKIEDTTTKLGAAIIESVRK